MWNKPVAMFAAAIAALALAGRPAAALAQTSTSKVAVANLVRIFGQLQKTKDLQSQMQTKSEVLKSQRLVKESEIRDLTAKRDLLNPAAPERQALDDEVVEKTITLQAWLAIRKHEMERQQKVQTLAIYGEITAAIAKIAEQKGIEIVVAEQKPEIPGDLEQVGVQQLQQFLAQRNVLYTKALADISDAVILHLDAAYKSGAISPPPSARPSS